MSNAKAIDNNKKPITSYLEDATPLLSNPAQLRKQAEELGYLYFRGFLAGPIKCSTFDVPFCSY